MDTSSVQTFQVGVSAGDAPKTSAAGPPDAQPVALPQEHAQASVVRSFRKLSVHLVVANQAACSNVGEFGQLIHAML
eukprot:3479504-Amphidinium_carterae.1